MTGTLHEAVCTLMIIYGLIVVRMEMLRTKHVEKNKTHILCTITFSRKRCSFSYHVENYRGPKLATNNHMTHALCMLDT